MPKPEPNAEAEADKLNLATNIARISEGMECLLTSGLNRRAIIVLLQHHTGLSQASISAVLNGLENLKHNYTTKR